MMASLNTSTQFPTWNSTDDAYFQPPLDIGDRAREYLWHPIPIMTLILIFVAAVTNISLIIATQYCRGGVTTHKKLIISLAVSDTCTCLSVLMHELNKIFIIAPSPEPNDRLLAACLFSVVHAFNVMSHLISLLNLAAMAIDHHIAIKWPFVYQKVMRKRNGVIIICCMWFLSILGGFSNFLGGIGYTENPFENYCEHLTFSSTYHSDYIVYGLVPVCVTLISYIYLSVYCVVRRLNREAPAMNRNLNNTMKASVTTLIIITAFTICYLPKILCEFILVFKALTDPDWLQMNAVNMMAVARYLYALTLLNCLLDPIIYALRLSDIQVGYRRAFRCCFSWCRKRRTGRSGTTATRKTLCTSATYNSSLNGSDQRFTCNGGNEEGISLLEINTGRPESCVVPQPENDRMIYHKCNGSHHTPMAKSEYNPVLPD